MVQAAIFASFSTRDSIVSEPFNKPDLSILVKLNSKRRVTGVLRGSDAFMNLTIEDAQEIISATEKEDLGTVVIRGMSIEMWECVDRVRA